MSCPDCQFMHTKIAQARADADSAGLASAQLQRELNKARLSNDSLAGQLALATAIVEREGNRNDALNTLKAKFPKDHEIAQATNELRDIAIAYHDTQQLRAQISAVVLRLVPRT